MWLAVTARDDLVPQRTDGVRHPLWSWIARVAYTEDKQVFFERGKWLNTLLCVAFLCGLGIAVARWLDPLATANLLLLSSLGILVVRGTYFQPEPLYYILFFLAVVLGWRILRGACFLAVCLFRHRLRVGVSLQALARAVPRRSFASLLPCALCLTLLDSKFRMEYCPECCGIGSGAWDSCGDAYPAGNIQRNAFRQAAFQLHKVLDVDG